MFPNLLNTGNTINDDCIILIFDTIAADFVLSFPLFYPHYFCKLIFAYAARVKPSVIFPSRIHSPNCSQSNAICPTISSSCITCGASFQNLYLCSRCNSIIHIQISQYLNLFIDFCLAQCSISFNKDHAVIGFVEFFRLDK